MAKKAKGATPHRSYDDNPISDPGDDLLGFGKHCVPTLVNIIEDCGTPYVIGVYGPWGFGKTSLMNLTQNALDKKKHKTIWINPWKYSGTEDVRKALVRTVYTHLRAGFQIKASFNIEHLKATGKEGAKMLGNMLGRFANVGDVGTELEQMFSLDPIFKNLFEEVFTSLLDEFLEKDKRLVVFIDDLDRCIPEVVIDIFEAIKLYLDVPRCVFVFGASPDIVEKGVFCKYREYFLKAEYLTREEHTEEGDKGEGKGLEGREHPLMTGREYMEKIIQLPFPVPQPESEDLEQFILENAKSVGLREDYKDWKKHLVDVVVAATQSNPRNMKRLLASVHVSERMADLKAINLGGQQSMKLAKVCAIAFGLSDEELRALWICPDLAWPKQEAKQLTGAEELDRMLKAQSAKSDSGPTSLLRRETRPQWGDRIRNCLSIQRLWKVGPQIESVDEFEKLLRLTSRAVALKSALPDEEQLLDLLKMGDWSIIEALGRRIENSEDVSGWVSFFAGLLEDQQQPTMVRRNSALVLGLLGQSSPQAIPSLVSALRDENRDIRQRAAAGLGQSGQAWPEVINALMSALDDQTSLVRGSSASALGELGQASPETVNALVSALKDKDWTVRMFAAKSLGKLGQSSPETIAAVFSALKDEKSTVRLSAVEALGRLAQPSPQVIYGLISALKDKGRGLPEGASDALRKIGRSSPAEVLKPLEDELSTEKDVKVRRWLLSIVADIEKGQSHEPS